MTKRVFVYRAAFRFILQLSHLCNFSLLYESTTLYRHVYFFPEIFLAFDIYNFPILICTKKISLIQAGDRKTEGISYTWFTQSHAGCSFSLMAFSHFSRHFVTTSIKMLMPCVTLTADEIRLTCVKTAYYKIDKRSINWLLRWCNST